MRPVLNLTDDQEAALKVFQETPPEKLIHNLRVSSEDGALVRTKPYSLNPDNLQDPNFDLTDKKFKKGDPIPESIVVKGQDPRDPAKANKQSDWYFYKDETGKTGYFVWSGNIVEAPVNNPSAQNSFPTDHT
jgi:hypothetical protein